MQKRAATHIGTTGDQVVPWRNRRICAVVIVACLFGATGVFVGMAAENRIAVAYDNAMRDVVVKHASAWVYDEGEAHRIARTAASRALDKPYCADDLACAPMRLFAVDDASVYGSKLLFSSDYNHFWRDHVRRQHSSLVESVALAISSNDEGRITTARVARMAYEASYLGWLKADVKAMVRPPIALEKLDKSSLLASPAAETLKGVEAAHHLLRDQGWR